MREIQKHYAKTRKMADKISAEVRSRNMAAIRSKGNVTTELAVLKLFQKERITGWRRHYKQLPGKPDFVFPKLKLAIFVDGCYWHGCEVCGLSSKSNQEYWKPKIAANIARDRRNTADIRKRGWRVLRIREHELKKETAVLKKLNRVLNPHSIK